VTQTDGDVRFEAAVLVDNTVDVVPDARQPADDGPHGAGQPADVVTVRRPGVGGGEAPVEVAGEQAADRLGVDAEQDPAELVMCQLEVRR